MSDEPDLGDIIDDQIRAGGPISLATYMSLCLSHPKRGYYAQGEPLGAKGDFITAPEISQMFGELIGFFLVNLWQQMGEPPSFTLLELGPGRGTLMEDALRVACRAQGFADGLHLQLFESNANLRSEQAKHLSLYTPYWSETVDAVSEDPLLVVANEFFDALPIRQFVATPTGWRERLVGLREDKRVFGLSPMPFPIGALPPAVVQAEPGAVYEVSLAGQQIVRQLASLIARQSGAMLIIDYGHEPTGLGETLQAVRSHAYADPLEAPGQTDISAHVDFEALGDAARDSGLIVHPVTTQGEFLQRLGINERAAALVKANPGARDDLDAALNRLVGEEAMGKLFKVFCATSPGLQPLGLSP